MTPNIDQGKEIAGKGASLCWDCENTSRYRCSWFWRNPVMPKGAEYYVCEHCSQHGGTRYVIKKCPNYKKEEVEYREIEVKPSPQPPKKRYKNVAKPETMHLINDKPLSRIGTYGVIQPLKWAANVTGFSDSRLGAEIGLAGGTTIKILKHNVKFISVCSYNKIAKYINKLLKEGK